MCPSNGNTATSTKTQSARMSCDLFSATLIKFNNGLRRSIWIHVLQCTVLMLYLPHLKTNTNKMSICIQIATVQMFSEHLFQSAMVTYPAILAMQCLSSHRLQSLQFSFTLSHTQHTHLHELLTMLQCSRSGGIDEWMPQSMRIPHNLLVLIDDHKASGKSYTFADVWPMMNRCNQKK